MSVDVTSSDSDRSARSDRGWGKTTALVVGSWAVLFAAVIGVGWLIIHPLEGSVGDMDDDVARWFADQRTPTLNDIADIGTLLGDTIVELILAPVVAVAVWIWRRSLVPALFVALATAGVGAIYILAATIDPRRRPPVKILDPGLVPTHSFPSGHVGTATALYGCIVVLTWTYARAARWWITPVLVLPLAVLVARLYQGAHHLTDVLTSLVFASLWVATLAVLLFRGHATAAKTRPVR